MTDPTPEEIREAKALALARFGRDEVLLVTMGAPINLTVGVAPLDFRSLCDLADAQTRDVETPKRATVMARLVFPASSVVTDVLDRRGAAPNKVISQLFKRAGQSPGVSVVKPLADVLTGPAGDYEVIPGLSRAKALELQAAAGADELWTVVGPGPLSLVMAAPDADVYLAARNAAARARVKCERTVESKFDFAKPLVRWTARPLDALLDDLPALVQDINDAFDQIAGEAAEASSKSV